MELVDIQENRVQVITLTFESNYDNEEILTLNIKKSDAERISEFLNR